MTNRTTAALLLVLLAAGLSGCDGASPRMATAPTTTTGPAVVPRPDDYTLSDAILSGMVFEETAGARAPIEGATVYCEPCGAETHTFAYTDSKGFYSFTGVWTNPAHFPTRISITKDGYADPDGVPKPTPPNPSGSGWREVVVDGDTRFDVQLVRR